MVAAGRIAGFTVFVATFTVVLARDAHARCKWAGENCIKGVFDRGYCVPLDLNEEKPITFKDGKLKFPAVPSVSEDYCTKYLNRYPWVAKDKDPEKKYPAWHRDDWVAGSCDCSEWDGSAQEL
ncbi:unnamed protein product [Prorocentrum cordatum]|uniref:Uncharacterized protein n=1 Tax=Prorocentrum cordatum TaxID=2364126 RepID=A0ABN9Q6Z7_9DINO|nr:unnamed protein product [Polarella glacialis]|mmetsp:Transcript_60812/g.157764  ORF Transcript_60812/g.157764 Transcript_60812/m.157764 type:complete len:123 (-) Transcript_60812:257-625(-)